MRSNEAGNDIVIPESSSPRTSLDGSPTNGFQRDSEKSGISRDEDSSNRTLADEGGATNYPSGKGNDAVQVPRERKQKRTFLGMLGGKSQDRKEEMDDNNGKEKKKFTAMGQLRSTLFNSWINVLLIACKL